MMMKHHKSALVFPCDFPIKIMGPATLEFEVRVISIIRKHTPDLGEAAIKIRRSKPGAYIAITATIHAKNKQQLNDIYQELSNDDQVLMLL
jgi:putative lipoic acid-binding regulatory protein